MPEVSDSYVQLETNLRASICAIIQSLPDSGYVHERERFTNDEREYKELFTILSNGVSVLRYAIVNLRDVSPEDDTFSSKKLTLKYTIELVYSLEDKRTAVVEGAMNSTQGFNQLRMRALEAFDEAASLGFNPEMINHDGLKTLEPAELTTIDGFDAHRTVFGLDVTVDIGG